MGFSAEENQAEQTDCFSSKRDFRFINVLQAFPTMTVTLSSKDSKQSSKSFVAAAGLSHPQVFRGITFDWRQSWVCSTFIYLILRTDKSATNFLRLRPSRFSLARSLGGVGCACRGRSRRIVSSSQKSLQVSRASAVAMCHPNAPTILGE